MTEHYAEEVWAALEAAQLLDSPMNGSVPVPPFTQIEGSAQERVLARLHDIAEYQRRHDEAWKEYIDLRSQLRRAEKPVSIDDPRIVRAMTLGREFHFETPTDTLTRVTAERDALREPPSDAAKED